MEIIRVQPELRQQEVEPGPAGIKALCDDCYHHINHDYIVG